MKIISRRRCLFFAIPACMLMAKNTFKHPSNVCSLMDHSFDDSVWFGRWCVRLWCHGLRGDMCLSLKGCRCLMTGQQNSSVFYIINSLDDNRLSWSEGISSRAGNWTHRCLNERPASAMVAHHWDMCGLLRHVCPMRPIQYSLHLPNFTWTSYSCTYIHHRENRDKNKISVGYVRLDYYSNKLCRNIT